PYPALHDELEALVKVAGLTPREVITAATLHGARTIGRERDYGTIEPGKFASLVFVRGNPLADIANLRTVELTVKRGRPYPRAAYRRGRA
ncbi:MAG: amidohydrolase family protein, partial [Gemmatimonadetes bacterium]|nr:amidohydrolase family protein [Gemmatimonadota bacterium]